MLSYTAGVLLWGIAEKLSLNSGLFHEGSGPNRRCRWGQWHGRKVFVAGMLLFSPAIERIGWNTVF